MAMRMRARGENAEGARMRREILADGVEIYCGDCREIMPTLGHFDAVVTDPPFFTPAVHYQSRVKHARSWGDMSILESWWNATATDIARICPVGHVYVFCNGDSYPAFYKAMFPLWDKLKCMVWDKEHVGLGRIFRNQHELIIWARSEGHYVPDDGKLRADVIRAKATPPASREHPVEKPVALLLSLCETAASSVLDPFAGSGSTGAAAVAAGKRFTGIEIEPKYFDIARRRLESELAKQRLPLDEPAPRPVQSTMFDGDAA